MLKAVIDRCLVYSFKDDPKTIKSKGIEPKKLPGFEKEYYEYVIRFKGKCPKKANLKNEITNIFKKCHKIIDSVDVDVNNKEKGNLHLLICIETSDNHSCLVYELIDNHIEDFVSSYNETSLNNQLAV